MQDNKTTVYLIRHGEIDNPDQVLYGGNINFQLTEEGREHIRKTAEKMKAEGLQIAKIYTSPMDRAKESAKILKDQLGVRTDIVVDPRLIDAIIPIIAGKPKRLRLEIHKKGMDEYEGEYVKLGNEARMDIVKRMHNAFKRVVRENRGKQAIIVSHGDPLRFLRYRLEHPEGEVPGMNVLKNTDYPQKGEAIKNVVDSEDKIVEKGTI